LHSIQHLSRSEGHKLNYPLNKCNVIVTTTAVSKPVVVAVLLAGLPLLLVDQRGSKVRRIGGGSCGTRPRAGVPVTSPSDPSARLSGQPPGGRALKPTICLRVATGGPRRPTSGEPARHRDGTRPNPSRYVCDREPGPRHRRRSPPSEGGKVKSQSRRL